MSNELTNNEVSCPNVDNAPKLTAKALKELKERDMENADICGMFYTDGGCKPSRGIGGWGIHGYVYKDIKATKGYGLTDWLITNVGYVPKKDNDKEQITVFKFVDGFGSLIPESTNNQAELHGVIEAFKYTLINELTKVDIHTDSKYVFKGTQEWLEKWKASNWIKGDGTEVSNKELWLVVDSLITDLNKKDIKWTVNWIEGHSGHLGNDQADYNATVGVVIGRKGISHSNIKETKSEGYWKSSIDTNRFFSYSKWYFNTNVPNNMTHDDRTVYYIGSHGKDDDFLGKQMSDASYSVICLKEPIPVLEIIREYQSKIDQNGFTSVVIARLENIFKAKVFKEIENYGELTLTAPGLNLDIYTPDETLQLTKELRPPKLAFNLSDIMNVLETILFKVRKSDKVDEKYPDSIGNITITDITDTIYESKDSKNKKCKIRKDFNSALKSFSVNVKQKANQEAGETKITLSVGIDTPSRNSLSAIAELSPKVYVVTWPESNHAFRYATIVETQSDYGIWAGFYSNIQLLI